MKENNKKERLLEVCFNIFKNQTIKLKDGDKTIGEIRIEYKNPNLDDNVHNSVDLKLKHERSNGKEKVITFYSLVSHNISLLTEDIFSDHDYIFVIDTNYKNVNESLKLCASAIGLLGRCEQGIFLKKLMNLTFELWDDNSNPERLAWKLFIEKILQIQKLHDKKIGIVVDSELGLIGEFNNRKKYIIDSFYLPENFRFIYASADKNDTVLNWAIKQCDIAAGKILNYIILNHTE